MRDASRDSGAALFGRRNFIRTAGVAAAGVAMSGTASAYHDNYEAVVDIVDEGADDTGEESINPVLDDLEEDSILIEFPDGEYKMDRQFRHTGFDDFGLVAQGDDAVIRPVPADEWNDDEQRLFKLGTYYSPGGRLRVQGLTFDYTAPNTGLRALQAQVDNPYVRWITVEGRHDTGNWGPGPMLVDVIDPDGTGRVERVNLRDGGAMVPGETGNDVGPIGFSVSPYHEGTLRVTRVRVNRFPNNGFYCSAENGRTIVEKGVYSNSHVANIRLAGENSEVRGSHVIVNRNPDGFFAQNGIRLDGGSGYTIKDVKFFCRRPTGNGIRVMGDAGATRIDNVSMILGDQKEDAIYVDGGSGPVDILRSDVEKKGPGQALQIESGGDRVYVESFHVSGDAPGSDGGRHAIRCERDHCDFRWLQVKQPGEDYRRALTILGDSCHVVGGRYESTHHPIVVDADDFDVRDIEARAYNDREGIKVYGGNDGGRVLNSTIYNGIDDRGSDFETGGNEYPDS